MRHIVVGNDVNQFGVLQLAFECLEIAIFDGNEVLLSQCNVHMRLNVQPWNYPKHFFCLFFPTQPKKKSWKHFYYLLAVSSCEGRREGNSRAVVFLEAWRKAQHDCRSGKLKIAGKICGMMIWLWRETAYLEICGWNCMLCAVYYDFSAIKRNNFKGL